MRTFVVIISALAATAAAQNECASPVPAPEVCGEPGICVEGRGLQLYSGTESGQYLYKDESGRVSFPKDIPSVLKGRSFLTYDNYPDYGPDSKEFDDDLDSRTDEVIQRVQSDSEGQLMIAVPSADAAGNGWARVNSGGDADFVLDNDGTDDDSNLSYWLYSHDYTEPRTWVDMPPQTEDGLPPFVFGSPEGTITFANPLPLPNGAVITTAGLIANPTLTIVPGEFDGDGDGVADGDVDGDGQVDNNVYLANASGGEGGWKVWRSIDQGKTWERWAKFGVNLNRETLFWHDGSVYLMGTLKHPDEAYGEGIIYRSTDGGKTFSENTVLPFDAGDAPANVQIADGRIWKAVPGPDADGNKGSTLASAPVDADLMNIDSWTVAKVSIGSGNEGITLLTREGRVVNAAKGRDGTTGLVYANGKDQTEFDPDTDSSPLPHHGKFSIQYDDVSDKYWALANGEGGQPRNVINLFSSTDLKSWELEREVLRGPSSRYHGFNYPSMLIEGDDIVFVSRTAWETPYGHNGRWHDAKMFTFHRVEKFREAM